MVYIVGSFPVGAAGFQLDVKLYLFSSLSSFCACVLRILWGHLRKYLWWIEYLLVLLSFSIELIFKSSIENMSWQVLGCFG